MHLPRSPRALRRLRLGAAVVLALSFVVFFVASRRYVAVHLGQGWFARLGNAVIEFGVAPSRFAGAGWETGAAWHFDWSLAWRPFRVHASGWHSLAIPLWPVPTAALLALGWSQGALGVLARLRRGQCTHCGYDISATPAREGVRRCPECGVVAAAGGL